MLSFTKTVIIEDAEGGAPIVTGGGEGIGFLGGVPIITGLDGLTGLAIFYPVVLENQLEVIVDVFVGVVLTIASSGVQVLSTFPIEEIGKR